MYNIQKVFTQPFYVFLYSFFIFLFLGVSDKIIPVFPVVHE